MTTDNIEDGFHRILMGRGYFLNHAIIIIFATFLSGCYKGYVYEMPNKVRCKYRSDVGYRGASGVAFKGCNDGQTYYNPTPVRLVNP